MLEIRRTLAPAVVLLATILSTATANAQTRRALVIGIDKYEQPASRLAAWRKTIEPVVAAWRMRVRGSAFVAQAGAQGRTGAAADERRATVPDLDGSVNDAVAIASLLRTSRYGFTDVRVDTNAQATRATILADVTRLADDAHPGDVVVVFYAGHGSQRYNSLARAKVNRLDQTIVPVDANAGQFDIRFAELDTIFDRLLDKNVTLTLIFDSCHSGGAVRGVIPGKKRWAAADPRDALDSSAVVLPTRKGALVLAAAQDFELAMEADADGVAHGAFTQALLQVMNDPGVSTSEPASQTFRRVRAIMQQNDLNQHPMMDGGGDGAQPLFGPHRPGGADRLTLAVKRVEDDGTVVLQGGLEFGFGVGTELRPADSTKGGARLRVAHMAGLGSSTANVIAKAGEAAPRPGQLYVVDKWILPAGPALRTWIPAPLPAPAIAQAATTLAALQQSSAVEWISDPTETGSDADSTSVHALYVVRHDAAGWMLQAPSGALTKLASPTAAVVESAIASAESAATRADAASAAALHQTAPTRGKPRVFVILPPTPELRSRLAIGDGTRNPAIAVQSVAKGVDYLLVGRDSAGAVRYAWMRPNASGVAARFSSLPVRTSWYAERPSSATALGDSLTSLALLLARVNGWLTIKPPADAQPFPYRFALLDSATGTAKDSGQTHQGDRYGFLLRRDPQLTLSQIPKRWVYIFVVDSKGNGTPLWDGTIPIDSAGRALAPVEIRERETRPFGIAPPFGTDTFIMVASDEQLDPQIFRFKGVNAGATRGETCADGGLAQLFCRTTGVSRGPDDQMPSAWWIQRLPLESRPRGQ